MSRCMVQRRECSGCGLDGIANIPLLCLWLQAHLQASKIRVDAHLRAVDMFTKSSKSPSGASLMSVPSLLCGCSTNDVDSVQHRDGLSGDDIRENG